MDKEIYLASNDTLNINFVHKGKSYRVVVDNELGLISTYEIFECENDKLINMYEFASNRNVSEEFMTVGDWGKVYDFLICSKREFLQSYTYIDEDSYEMSWSIAMNPSYMADLMRKAENLYQREVIAEDGEWVDYMQEEGTDYISAEQWKWAIVDFVNKYYPPLKKQEFQNICDSMSV